MSIKEEIAKNLLFYRKKSKLTQKELADKLNVKNTAVSNWESGNNSIDIDTLFKACEVFGITLNDIYGKYNPVSADLSAIEEQLVADYRDASEEIRDEAAGMLSRSAERNRKERGKSALSAG